VTAGFDNVVKTGGGLGVETVNFAATATTGGLEVRNGTNLDGGLTVQGAALTSVSLNSTGSAANTVNTLTTPNGVTSLSLTGDQKVTITTALNNNILSVNAGSDTGGVNVTLGTAAAGKTVSVISGTGADVVSLANVINADVISVNLDGGNDVLKVAGNLATFSAGTVLDGGVGVDAINITNGATLTAATAAYIKGFEALDVSGGTGIYNTSLGGFTAFQADAGVNGAHAAVTLSNVASTGFAFSEIGQKGVNIVDTGLTVNLKNAVSTTDGATLNLTATDGNNDGVANGNVTLSTFVAGGGIENLTINSSVNGLDTGVSATKYTNTIGTLTDVSSTGDNTDLGLQTLTLTGNANLAISNAIDAATAANLTKIDASAATGNETIDYHLGAKAVTYLGSAGIDTVNASNGGTIYGAAGNDQITLGGATAFKAGVASVQTLDLSAADTGTAAGTDTVSVTIGGTTVTTAAVDTTSDTAVAAAIKAAVEGNATTNALVSVTATATTDVFTYKAIGAQTAITFNGNVDGGAAVETGTVTQTTPGTGVLAAANTNADTLVYKAASDAQLKVNGANVDATSTVETVTNFLTTNSGDLTHAHDTIDLSAIGSFTGYARGAMTITGVDPLSGTFAASQTNFFNDGIGNRGLVLDQVAGSTYVFVDVNHDGSFSAQQDMVIKLAGVTNVTATDFNFG
jgi:hypothetical protein